MTPRILVRPPSPNLAAGQLTHLARTEIDAGRAREQWDGYVEAFRTHGWVVTEVEPADEFPDGVFVEDTVVVFDDLAVLTSPGAPSAVGELATTERAITASASPSRPAESSRPGTWTAATCSRSGGPRTSAPARVRTPPASPSYAP